MFHKTYLFSCRQKHLLLLKQMILLNPLKFLQIQVLILVHQQLFLVVQLLVLLLLSIERKTPTPLGSGSSERLPLFRYYTLFSYAALLVVIFLVYVIHVLRAPTRFIRVNLGVGDSCDLVPSMSIKTA